MNVVVLSSSGNVCLILLSQNPFIHRKWDDITSDHEKAKAPELKTPTCTSVKGTDIGIKIIIL